MTFTTAPVIWLHVEGEPGGDLVRRLLRWFGDGGPRPVQALPWSTGYAGGSRTVNVFRAGFSPDAAEQVVEWLRAQGCEARRGEG